MTHTTAPLPEWLTDDTHGDLWHRTGHGTWYRNVTQDDCDMTYELITELYGIVPMEQNWDALITRAPWKGNDAESGPFSLHRDESGLVSIYQWIDNRPVLQATVKA